MGDSPARTLGAPPHWSLTGKRALVTASSHGLGTRIAYALADAGANVAVHYRRDRSAAVDVMDSLPVPEQGTHCVVAADLTDASAVEAAVADAAEQLGGLEILVNNCGPFALMPLTEITVPTWDEILDANLRSAWLASRTAARLMQPGGWGRIVNVSAGSAFARNHSVYGLAKAALNVLTEQLAVELGPEVTVNAVAPGQIAESAAEIADYDPTFADRFVAASPLGRLARRDEVADCIVALCSPAFDMLTGAVLPLDGGCRIPRF